MKTRVCPYDEVWAEICRWLQCKGLILHVFIKGPIWFEDYRAAGGRILNEGGKSWFK